MTFAVEHVGGSYEEKEVYELLAAIAYGLSLIFLKAEEWSYYTKPFTPQSLILTMVILLIVVQMILWSVVKKIREKKNKATA